MQLAPSTLILGLGNEILRDDGVGLRAARRVAELAGDLADHVEACVATVDLLEPMAGYRRVVVVDAFLSRRHPVGTELCGAPDDLPAGFGYRSMHSLSFGAMLRLGRRLQFAMPDEMHIHGLSVEDPETFGSELSPLVQAVWSGWAERIYRREFGSRPARGADSARHGSAGASLGVHRA